MVTYMAGSGTVCIWWESENKLSILCRYVGHCDDVFTLNLVYKEMLLIVICKDDAATNRVTFQNKIFNNSRQLLCHNDNRSRENCSTVISRNVIYMKNSVNNFKYNIRT